jgi:hypothetical protein
MRMRDVTTDAALLIRVFDSTFAAEGVCLLGGAAEPLYEPAQGEGPARLWFTQDYASSALHEAAHWCLAGARRRTCVDFDYRYVPAARRSEAEQAAFEHAEVRTQALEWRLSLAARVPFHLSVDSIGRDRAPFRARVVAEVRRRIAAGWPPRIDRLAVALAAATGGVACPAWDDFALELDDV